MPAGRILFQLSRIRTTSVLWTTEKKYLFGTLILGPKEHRFKLKLCLDRKKFSLQNIYQTDFSLGVITLPSLQFYFFLGAEAISCLPPPTITMYADLVNQTSVCELFFIFPHVWSSKIQKQLAIIWYRRDSKDIGQTVSLCHNKTRCFLRLSTAIPVRLCISGCAGSQSQMHALLGSTTEMAFHLIPRLSSWNVWDEVKNSN